MQKTKTSLSWLPLSKDEGSEAGSSGEENRAAERTSTCSDNRGRLGEGAVVAGEAGRGNSLGGARDVDRLVDDSGDDSGDRGGDRLDRVGGASRSHCGERGRVRGVLGGRGTVGSGGVLGGPDTGRHGTRGGDGADSGGDGDGLSDNGDLVLGALGHGIGAVGNRVDRGAVDGRGGQGDDGARDNSRLGGAVAGSDGRTARGDGNIVG